MGRRNKGRRNRSPSSSEEENEDFGEAVIEVTGWVDGEKQTKRLEAPDRWKIHTADNVVFRVAEFELKLRQRPHDDMVGFYVWEGAFLLAKFLEHHVPRHRWLSTRVVELGAGTGLVGLLLARLGAAEVVLTDLVELVPFLLENVEDNITDREQRNRVQVCELKWGDPNTPSVINRLRGVDDQPIDVVLAADCLYEEAAIVPFIDALEGLLSPSSSSLPSSSSSASLGPVAWVASERRTELVRNTFVQEAEKRFQLTSIPLTLLPPSFRRSHVELWELRCRSKTKSA